MRAQVDVVRDGDPGRRFREWNLFLVHVSPGLRAVQALLGIVVASAGLFMLVFPGPGLVALAFGFAFVGGQSRLGALALDWVEFRSRHRWRRLRAWWSRQHRVTHLAAVLGTIVAVVAIGWVAWFYVWPHLERWLWR